MRKTVAVKRIQDSRKLLRALENLTNETIHAEQYFTDELHLFFQYLCRKVLKELDLSNPLESLFYLKPNNVIEKYWEEYDKIFSYYVDVGATIGNIHYDILLNASKAHAKEFASTKSKDTIQSLLDYKFNSSEDDTLFKPDPKVSSRLKRYKFEASERTKSRVTEDINNILGEAYREGWGPRHVGEKIQERFDQLSGYEARRIAQTELNTTRNLVQYNRLQDDGMEYKIWHAAHDARTRPSHLDVDEEIVPIGERFSNGLMYPGDKSGPIREWVNCRCSHAAYIMPLGYAAPDFFPFTEADLIEVGSTDSKDYVDVVRERLGLGESIAQGVATERERQKVTEEPIVEPKPVETVKPKKPKASKPKPVKPEVEKPKPKPKTEPKVNTTVDVNRMSSNELYESMTKADKKKYDKAKTNIENLKKSVGVDSPLFKKMTEKHYKTINDLEKKQREKLLKKGKKETKTKLTKQQEKELQTFKEETPLNDFDKAMKWADKRVKGKIEYGYKFDTKTGKIIGEEIRGSKGNVTMIDQGENVGSMHIHTEDGMSFPSDTDIISYRCQKEKDHYILSKKEVWYVHAEDNFGMMGRLTQADVTKAYAKCIKEGNAAVEKLMREGKIGLDEKSIQEACDKEIGDRLLEEFSKKEWADKGLIVRRAYR